MKTLILTLLTIALIIPSLKTMDPIPLPKPARAIAEPATRSLAHCNKAPIRCPFIQAGSF